MQRTAERVRHRRRFNGWRRPKEPQAAVTALTSRAGERFAWAASEASEMAALRPLLVAKGSPKEALKVGRLLEGLAKAFHAALQA